VPKSHLCIVALQEHSEQLVQGPRLRLQPDEEAVVQARATPMGIRAKVRANPNLRLGLRLRLGLGLGSGSGLGLC